MKSHRCTSIAIFISATGIAGLLVVIQCAFQAEENVAIPIKKPPHQNLLRQQLVLSKVKTRCPAVVGFVKV